MPDTPNLTSSLRETRLFPPPAAFAAQAHVPSLDAYRALYRRSIEHTDAFWLDIAAELAWSRFPSKALEWSPNALDPEIRWFADGTLNLAYNCLDRHIEAGRGAHPALIWEGEPGEIRTLTYSELRGQTARCANMLLSLGVRQGDRVAIYMGMTPEVAVAMLACARIGAVHSVIFGGFAPQAIADRVLDSDCRLILTQDGAYRRGTELKLKPAVDEALKLCPPIREQVRSVVVLRRTGSPVAMQPGRDLWWHDELAKADPTCPPVALQAEDPLFILYTSGSTGKPKGLLHTQAGYAVQAYLTAKLVFDLHPQDIFWCTADVGWITGHSYNLYGALLNGITTLFYEGALACPDPDRTWQIIDRHRVTVFYTAPTAIRAFMQWGDAFPRKADLTTVRVLGTVGEPINPEVWMWYHTEVGRGRCPIADTWFQTETGTHMLTPLPGAITAKPGSATVPFFGIEPAIVNKQGAPVPQGHGGLLVIRKPWPSIARTIWGDHARYLQTYWTDIPGMYFTGDSARLDPDGCYWLMGRVDDVLNVSGHRLGTMEIESTLVAHAAVSEAAAVGRPHDLKGEAIACFVTLKTGQEPSKALRETLRAWVAGEIGSFARPDDIRFVEALPKTRSGKIMRRLLRELAQNGEIRGDTTTLEDFAGLAKLHEKDE